MKLPNAFFWAGQAAGPHSLLTAVGVWRAIFGWQTSVYASTGHNHLDTQSTPRRYRKRSAL